ncbi:MAG: hypothetical protein COB16_06575 [Rhodobacteraceae bacterium]|nr:MAG: hypothetical protein COB16_06575 [Paracoccaceae bacterium]
MSTHTPTGSKFLDHGKTPAEWAEILCGRGVTVTERTIREKANKLSTCGKLGKEMLILPEHLDEMFMEDQSCHSKSIPEGASGGSRAGLNTKVCQSLDTTDKALVHLHKLAQPNGPKSKRTGKGVVTSLVKKRSN